MPVDHFWLFRSTFLQQFEWENMWNTIGCGAGQYREKFGMMKNEGKITDREMQLDCFISGVNSCLKAKVAASIHTKLFLHIFEGIPILMLLKCRFNCKNLKAEFKNACMSRKCSISEWRYFSQKNT